ncbi:hypothetical protein KJ359_010556 [Pestalotiopsis sp. 9143b]|nr:hypothetical protein KJ359_010556 [Pestalotiopsis sp. 9143b]
MNEHIKRAHGPVDAGRETTATGLQSAPGTFDRVSQDQWTRIGKLARDKDVKRKWEAIYQIIFPNDKPVTATYVPSAEQLQDYARSPPDWVIAEFKQVYGESQQEAIMSVNKFLTFYNIVRRGPLPHSTLSSRRIEQGQGSVSTYSTSEPDASGMREMEFFNPQGFVTVFSDDTFVGMAGMNVSYGLSQTLSTGHNILDEDECNEDMGTD